MAEDNDTTDVTSNPAGTEDDGGAAAVSADADAGASKPDAENIPQRQTVREIFAAKTAEAKAAADAAGVTITEEPEGGKEKPKADAAKGDDDGQPTGDDLKPTGDDAAKPGDGEPDDDKAKADAAPADDKAKADATAAAAAEAATAKQELDDLLATYDDPAVLNAALAKAGVQAVAELPAVKEIIGRISQSVRDQTKAEIERAAREAAQIAEATKEGKAAKDKLVAALKSANEALESDDPAATVELPTDESVDKAFEDYADAAVGEYHTKAWNVLSDSIYSLPELGGQLPEGYDGPPVPALNREQQALLASVKGADPAVWLAAHLTVQRDVVWEWAQAHAAKNGQTSFESEKVQLQAAHSNEVKKLTKAHDTALAAAREEARAEAIADMAAGKISPKLPVKKGATTERDPDENKPKKGATVREVHAWAKQQQDAAVQSGSNV